MDAPPRIAPARRARNTFSFLKGVAGSLGLSGLLSRRARNTFSFLKGVAGGQAGSYPAIRLISRNTFSFLKGVAGAAARPQDRPGIGEPATPFRSSKVLLARVDRSAAGRATRPQHLFVPQRCCWGRRRKPISQHSVCDVSRVVRIGKRFRRCSRSALRWLVVDCIGLISIERPAMPDATSIAYSVYDAFCRCRVKITYALAACKSRTSLFSPIC